MNRLDFCVNVKKFKDALFSLGIELYAEDNQGVLPIYANQEKPVLKSEATYIDASVFIFTHTEKQLSITHTIPNWEIMMLNKKEIKERLDYIKKNVLLHFEMEAA